MGWLLLIALFFILRTQPLASGGWINVRQPKARELRQTTMTFGGDWPLIKRDGKWYHRDHPDKELVTVSLEEFLKDNE